ncbi:hypothetical protein C922_05341 [Plasmodium inui San Antonio 1]|uniref:Uncharacterized protein n=1 Tax=Plasmodium inui San Antonio 1 TaxID=1237626 RepID=W6ZYA6_9APIC|nr:hypothetical protein C922_05341 [Plasmodium inui San Antonio 1]EUD64275.1 hypothetical protein C922_05341 [Plasmodium inui San Antonio 1]
MKIANDSDCTPERRLNSLLQENEFNTQFNTTKSTKSVQRLDNSYDSNETFPNYDNFADSCGIIDNSDESFVEINYHDEHVEVHNSDSTIYSEVQSYNPVEDTSPTIYSYRHRKKSIFSSLFKLLKEVDAEYERAIYNTLKNNVPHYIQVLYIFYKYDNCKYLTVLF